MIHLSIGGLHWKKKYIVCGFCTYCVLLPALMHCVICVCSAEMLVNLDIPWVILGHSERRAILKESNEVGDLP